MSDQMWVLPSEPAEFGIRFTPEARKKLLNSMPVHDMIYYLDGNVVNDPENPDWRVIEECLTELLAPPVRYMLGVDPSHDRCPKCGINARRAGATSCSSCGS